MSEIKPLNVHEDRRCEACGELLSHCECWDVQPPPAGEGAQETERAALVERLEQLIAKWRRANQWGDRKRADELEAALRGASSK
jgi:hypothetical protein